MNTYIDTRLGWPKELRFLLERYPREQWKAHANLGDMTRFWLKRHRMLRELGSALRDATVDFRDGTVSAAEFQPWFAPRLQFFLQQLNAHHHVEDANYFPILRAVEVRLLGGFEVLEKDHQILHHGILNSVGAGNDFLRHLRGDSDAVRSASDRYAKVNEDLLKRMLRHLDDEEDLIIPLILDRGEDDLGVA